MSAANDKCEAKKDSDGKNITTISCTFCPSKILNRGTATLIDQEFALPHMRRKEEGETDERETISEYWLVEDVYTFENILVSKTADSVKYLACADCERGPIGWHDIPTKKSYIALSRPFGDSPECCYPVACGQCCGRWPKFYVKKCPQLLSQ